MKAVPWLTAAGGEALSKSAGPHRRGIVQKDDAVRHEPGGDWRRWVAYLGDTILPEPQHAWLPRP